MVDPGGDLDRILAEIDSRKLVLEKILITHAHIDHAGVRASWRAGPGFQSKDRIKTTCFWIMGMPDQCRMF